MNLLQILGSSMNDIFENEGFLEGYNKFCIRLD